MQTQPITPSATRSFDPSHIYERIVVPIDLGETAHAAVATALDLRRRCGSQVILFNVAGADENDGFLGGTGASWSLADVVRAGLSRLRALVETIDATERDAVVYDVVGSIDLVKGIIAAAIRHDATLVILGIPSAPHAHVLRSRTERISRSLTCAVLQVHAGNA